MKIRKAIATITMAAMFFWAPSMVPARAAPPVGCGVTVTNWFLPSDTAFAVPLPVPCPASATTPWAVIGIGLSAFSVILNGLIVSQTQCRELTQQEAFASLGLPFIGWAFNTQNNKCPH
ncbi:MAG TPA: hypothetical protein VHA55_04010 [Pseudorhodoplanes sp.]|jgi:hypothetical protein|nr:hypothetical protein [Pseudorhodoplanes sp.]